MERGIKIYFGSKTVNNYDQRTGEDDTQDFCLALGNWGDNILVFYCCLTNYSKLSNFQPHTFIMSVSMGSPGMAWLVLCPGLTRLLSSWQLALFPSGAQSLLPNSWVTGRFQSLALVKIEVLFSCYPSASDCF